MPFELVAAAICRRGDSAHHANAHSPVARSDLDGVVQVPAGGWFEVSCGAGNFNNKVRYQATGSTFSRL